MRTILTSLILFSMIVLFLINIFHIDITVFMLFTLSFSTMLLVLNKFLASKKKDSRVVYY